MTRLNSKFRFGINCLFLCITLTLILTVNSILEYNVRQTVRRWTDRPLSATDRPLGEQTDRQEPLINRQTVGRWTDVRTDHQETLINRQNVGCWTDVWTDRQALDGQTVVGDGQAFG